MAATQTTAFQHDLAATAQHLNTVLPTAASAAIDRGIYEVAASGLLNQVRPAGQQAPDFTLPGADGQPVQLSQLLAQGPVVLTFYRGNWCPYCNVQLRAYQLLLPELARLGATLVAVSPQTPDYTSLTASEKALTFPVLSDVGNHVARQYGLAFGVGPEVATTLRALGIDLAEFNGTTADELPLTATFVIAPDGTIAWQWVDASFKHRAEPAEILAAVKQAAVAQVA
ncbi:AhpC/TSA family protein [Hymenobacter sp. RP-2-7]|uniref:thioredoxin-dependent peroxiredoxin n=1 Tax=Hymenobacter polaris TaxID=2682546 RepID=A0A7Y0AF59_9BACT|nr:peroxiredoxin-like family protein [Hymenobacter polaris]NML65945.1 AhpC/TSA family protein [Hymenobacter polaris]